MEICERELGRRICGFCEMADGRAGLVKAHTGWGIGGPVLDQKYERAFLRTCIFEIIIVVYEFSARLLSIELFVFDFFELDHVCCEGFKKMICC